jgi:hypothetical protein
MFDDRRHTLHKPNHPQLAKAPLSYALGMETVVHQVRELGDSDRSAAERLVGHPLDENQQLVIQVMNLDRASPEDEAGSETEQLPEWCNVYAGLSDADIETLERAISRRLDLTQRTT